MVANKKVILGFSRISSIQIRKNVIKYRYKCPECGIYEHYERVNIKPRYKCRNKHEFDKPIREKISVTQYTAEYKKDFLAPLNEISVKEFSGYYINYNRYYSIQGIDMAFLKKHYSGIYKAFTGRKPSPSSPDYLLEDFSNPPYEPNDKDHRNFTPRKTAERKGQKAFKSKLIRAYGERCMFSKCDVREAIQASHIRPYRGIKDDHPENGLLLRSDLHILFDADLLGIDPEKKLVHLHPSIAGTSYKQFLGKPLIIGTRHCPSRKALEIRWKMFKKKVGSHLP